MRKLIGPGAATCLLLVVGGCGSTSSTWDKAPATAAWIDEIVAATGHPELFENISEESDAAVRHRLSGLECHYGEERGSLKVIDNPAVAPGEDIFCNMWNGPIQTSLAVTGVRAAPTLDAVVARYWTSPDQGHAGAQPFTFVQTPTVDGGPQYPMPEVRVRRVTYKEKGMTFFYREALTVVDRWIVDGYVTTPVENAEDGERYGHMHMVVGIAGIVGRQQEKR
jgi:hypothetical protein